MSRLLGGRYEILEKIGEGGMAVVYKAKCTLLNRYVAIKILKPEFLEDKKFIENFRHESQAAASLTHPNIVNIYDVGLEGNNIHYIVMEYVEGETLNSIIEREERLSDRDTISIQRREASQYNSHRGRSGKNNRFRYCKSGYEYNAGCQRFHNGLRALFFTGAGPGRIC